MINCKIQTGLRFTHCVCIAKEKVDKKVLQGWLLIELPVQRGDFSALMHSEACYDVVAHSTTPSMLITRGWGKLWFQQNSHHHWSKCVESLNIFILHFGKRLLFAIFLEMVCVVLILYADRLIFELIKVNENINYKYRGMIFYILETQSTADNMKTEEK